MAHSRTPRTSRTTASGGRLRRLRVVLGLLGLAAFAATLFVVAVIALQRSFLVPPSTAGETELSPAQPAVTSTSAPALPQGPLDYVALGDSYAAGPGLTPTRDDPGACARSSNNYPAYLAQLLAVQSYSDVSCTGARPSHIEGSQRRPDDTLVPPQSRALGVSTDLVTLSLGGNELATLQDVVDACYIRATTLPDGPRCDETLRAEGDVALDRARDLEAAVADSLRQIRNAAPDAAVVLVSYPRVFPTARTCPELVIASSESAYLDQVLDAIVESTKRAASSAGVQFVDLRPASRGHQICSAAPWAVGPGAPKGGPRAWHPTLLGMQSVATIVHAALTGVEAVAPAGDARPPSGSMVTNPAG